MINKLKNQSIVEQEINRKIKSILRAKIDNEIDIFIGKLMPHPILSKKDKISMKQIVELFLH